MVKSYCSSERCTLPFGEFCQLHPIDCPNCTKGDTCQMRADMWKYRYKIKRCRFFEKKPMAQVTLGDSS